MYIQWIIPIMLPHSVIQKGCSAKVQNIKSLAMTNWLQAWTQMAKPWQNWRRHIDIQNTDILPFEPSERRPTSKYSWHHFLPAPQLVSRSSRAYPNLEGQRMIRVGCFMVSRNHSFENLSWKEPANVPGLLHVFSSENAATNTSKGICLWWTSSLKHPNTGSPGQHILLWQSLALLETHEDATRALHEQQDAGNCFAVSFGPGIWLNVQFSGFGHKFACLCCSSSERMKNQRPIVQSMSICCNMRISKPSLQWKFPTPPLGEGCEFEWQVVETPQYSFRWQKSWTQLPVFNAFQNSKQQITTSTKRMNFLKLSWATTGGAVVKSMYHLNGNSIQNESSQRIEPKLQASEGPNHQLWLCQEVHVEKCRSLQRKVFQSELLGIIATFWDAASWKFCEW